MAHLEVISIRIPPLREYAEDVPDLLRHYVDRLVDEEAMTFRRFSVAAQNRLRNYPWPGNVRELRNLVQRVLIIGGPEEIGLDEIEQHLVASRLPTSRASSRTCSRCRSGRRGSSSSGPTSCSSSCSAMERWACSRSGSAWSARICTASCAPWA